MHNLRGEIAIQGDSTIFQAVQYLESVHATEFC